MKSFYLLSFSSIFSTFLFLTGSFFHGYAFNKTSFVKPFFYLLSSGASFYLGKASNAKEKFLYAQRIQKMESDQKAVEDILKQAEYAPWILDEIPDSISIVASWQNPDQIIEDVREQYLKADRYKKLRKEAYIEKKIYEERYKNKRIQPSRSFYFPENLLELREKLEEEFFSKTALTPDAFLCTSPIEPIDLKSQQKTNASVADNALSALSLHDF